MLSDGWFVSVKEPVPFFSDFFILFFLANLNIVGHHEKLLCGTFSIALILS